MRFFEKIKDSPHYPRLRNSMEYQYCRKDFLVALAFFGFALALFVLGCIVDPPGAANAGSAAMLGLCLVLFFGLAAYKCYVWLEIFLHMECYHYTHVVLDRPYVEHTRYSHRVRYSVEFTDRHGKQIRRDTTAMFQNETGFVLEEYNNQRMLIGYNEYNDRVVIIQRADP